MIRYRFIKKPSSSDLRGIEALYRAQGWWKPSDRRAGLRRLVERSLCFIVAEEGGVIAGMGRAIDAHSAEAYLHDITVSREFRGRDIGSGLVRRMLRRLKSLGVGWVGLISSNNSWPFYRRLGFVTPRGARAMMKGGTNV
ncbi:MAG TPA: N-acetyltransferase [Elusimicrobia bacterium]|nr:N-acetyltransferase [Elusimicrobiota bacterium]